MSGARVFVPQEVVDRWLSNDEIELEGDLLRLKKNALVIKVSSAVYFSQELTETSDQPKLLGKVKDVEQLKTMGADLVHDSVVIGDVAYQVVEGFLGNVLAASKPLPDPSKESELDLLAKLFLESQ